MPIVSKIYFKIECGNILRPPANCLQYYTGTQGFVSSFNYILTGNTTYMVNIYILIISSLIIINRVMSKLPQL